MDKIIKRQLKVEQLNRYFIKDIEIFETYMKNYQHQGNVNLN